jgi:hypothetical protein
MKIGQNGAPSPKARARLGATTVHKCATTAGIHPKKLQVVAGSCTLAFNGTPPLMRPWRDQPARTSLALPRVQVGPAIKAKGGRLKPEFRTYHSALCTERPRPPAIQPNSISVNIGEYNQIKNFKGGEVAFEGWQEEPNLTQLNQKMKKTHDI